MVIVRTRFLAAAILAALSSSMAASGDAGDTGVAVGSGEGVLIVYGEVERWREEANLLSSFF